MNTSNTPSLSLTISEEHAGFRADRVLAVLCEAIPRRDAKLLFKAKLIRINGRIASGAERVKSGDVLEYPDPKALESTGPTAGSAVNNLLLAVSKSNAPRLTTPHGRHLQRLYEDDEILIISKPAEIPVHRGVGGFTRRDTIEDVLMEAYPPPEHASSDAQGFWFVHRLDMETSGCLLVAKTEATRDILLEAFSERKVHKEYIALVVGEVAWKRLSVDKPIKYVRAEDPVAPRASFRPWERTAEKTRRKGAPPMRGLKKGIITDADDLQGKSSVTHFQVISRFRGYTLVKAEPQTGRTHQIRVHLASIGHPLAYDPLYGRRSPLRLQEFESGSGVTVKGANSKGSRRSEASESDESAEGNWTEPGLGQSVQSQSVVLNRLPLHARKVGFTHPVSGEFIRVKAELPRDLKEFIRVLKKFRSLHL